MKAPRKHLWSATAAAALLLAGCVAGPDFQKPAPPASSALGPAPASAPGAEAVAAGAGPSALDAGGAGF